MSTSIFGCCCLLMIVSSNGIFARDSSIWSGRIIGGSTAHKGQFPYQVSLRSGLLQNHFCGGFIVTDRWLATAAHCTSGKLPWGVIAVVGAVARTVDGTKVKLSKFVSHPDYDKSNLRNDIALIKTEKTIDFTPMVQPIKLRASRTVEGTMAVVSGWGYTSNPGQAASNLQWIKVKVIKADECRNRMTKSNAERIFDTSICTESIDTGGACMGDSGGPLVANNIIIGIVSWGVPCNMGYPDVYTRINSYQEWINSVIDF